MDRLTVHACTLALLLLLLLLLFCVHQAMCLIGSTVGADSDSGGIHGAREGGVGTIEETTADPYSYGYGYGY